MRRAAALGLGCAVALGSLTLTACGGTSPDGTAAGTSPGSTTGASRPPVTVVATTTVLGSVVGEITDCAGGTTQTLMPAGADPHDFAPSARQVASLVTVDLVVANGLGLEEGLQDALASATTDGATVLEVGPQLDPLPFGTSDSLDPHVWQDVGRMATAAELVGTRLADITGDDTYRTCGVTVHDHLQQVDDQVRATLATVPESRRVLVTDHDSLGYLAAAYGFEVVGTVIPGGSTLAEPSSAELAALARTIEERDVRAIFTDATDPTALVDAVAAETGTRVQVVSLPLDSLGPPGSGAETYEQLVTGNAQRIADALGG